MGSPPTDNPAASKNADSNEPGRSGTPPRAFLQKSVNESEHDVAHYPEPTRSETIYAQSFCREYCRGDVQHMCELVASLDKRFTRSRSYFFNFLNGYYFTSPANSGPGAIGAWSEIVALLRAYETLQSGKLNFVETPTYKCFSDFILERMSPDSPCKFGGITGPTGSQKSKCAMYFQRTHNHCRTVYFEAPARKSLVSFQRKLAQQYDVAIKSNAAAREAEIRENVRSDRCIIIDNAQDLYFPNAGSDQPVFNYLRELQDDTGCTVILIFTEDFYQGDLTAGRAKGYFEQFIGRMGGLDNILKLPAYTHKSDLKAIARHYNITADGALKYLENWSREHGRVRIAFIRLWRAKQFAKLDGRDRITIADLKLANDYVPPATGHDEGGES